MEHGFNLDIVLLRHFGTAQGLVRQGPIIHNLAPNSTGTRLRRAHPCVQGISIWRPIRGGLGAENGLFKVYPGSQGIRTENELRDSQISTLEIRIRADQVFIAHGGLWIEEGNGNGILMWMGVSADIIGLYIDKYCLPFVAGAYNASRFLSRTVPPGLVKAETQATLADSFFPQERLVRAGNHRSNTADAFLRSAIPYTSRILEYFTNLDPTGIILAACPAGEDPRMAFLTVDRGTDIRKWFLRALAGREELRLRLISSLPWLRPCPGSPGKASLCHMSQYAPAYYTSVKMRNSWREDQALAVKVTVYMTRQPFASVRRQLTDTALPPLRCSRLAVTMTYNPCGDHRTPVLMTDSYRRLSLGSLLSKAPSKSFGCVSLYTLPPSPALINMSLPYNGLAIPPSGPPSSVLTSSTQPALEIYNHPRYSKGPPKSIKSILFEYSRHYNENEPSEQELPILLVSQYEPLAMSNIEFSYLNRMKLAIFPPREIAANRVTVRKSCRGRRDEEDLIIEVPQPKDFVNCLLLMDIPLRNALQPFALLALRSFYAPCRSYVSQNRLSELIHHLLEGLTDLYFLVLSLYTLTLNMSDCRITYLEGRLIGSSPTERSSLRKSIEEQRTDPSWGHYTKRYSQTCGFTRDELESAALKLPGYLDLVFRNYIEGA
ncbi:hypothetical protein CBS147482_10907 [Aspergillus niger]|nr:hypothetical protein CBS147482_10907 [Aspergillus niger]